ncbi:MAG: DUF669 domain-containing protein [Ruminococcaceae bacterium]|nr:DUF669 domain-containing protein [Oscillospiraceae bacterium]
MSENLERAFDWDDEIEQESEFTLLPEGTYDFEVIKFERAMHNGSDKLPPCKKAVLTLKVSDDKGASTTIIHNLFLHTKTEGMLSAFFIAIGMKKHGEKVRMNWQQVIGAKGKCKVIVDTYNGNQYNKIKSFLEPKELPSANKYGDF